MLILHSPTYAKAIGFRSGLAKSFHLVKYSGTSPYGHLTSKTTSPLQSPWLSPKLYSTVQITPCNKVTSPLRSLVPSPVGDLNSEVPLYAYDDLEYSVDRVMSAITYVFIDLKEIHNIITVPHT